MKKNFVEPDIQRLKLNLRENIATSGGCSWPDIQFASYIEGMQLQMMDHYNYMEKWTLYSDLKSKNNVKEVVPFLLSLGSCVVWLSPLNNDE